MHPKAVDYGSGRTTHSISGKLMSMCSIVNAVIFLEIEFLLILQIKALLMAQPMKMSLRSKRLSAQEPMKWQ